MFRFSFHLEQNSKSPEIVVCETEQLRISFLFWGRENNRIASLVCHINGTSHFTPRETATKRVTAVSLDGHSPPLFAFRCNASGTPPVHDAPRVSLNENSLMRTLLTFIYLDKFRPFDNRGAYFLVVQSTTINLCAESWSVAASRIKTIISFNKGRLSLDYHWFLFVERNFFFFSRVGRVCCLRSKKKK